jgi:phosphatidylserine/phosphatidylglycerophosphate/cardiolipin synthase-like enzyme
LPVISNEGHYWVGKDYANTYKADFKDIADFSKDQFDRAETARMPWRDEGLVVFGDSARDLARHFIQRWNQCKVFYSLFLNQIFYRVKIYKKNYFKA